MISTEVIALVLTGLSISASILYYTVVLRNQNKTRQAQLYMQVWNRFASEEGTRRAAETRGYEWDDFQDFENKYGRENNIDAHAKRVHVWNEHNGIGLLLRKGLIDFDMVNKVAGGAIMVHWEKWEPIIREYRKVFDNPEFHSDWEYFYKRVKKYREDNF